MDRSVSIRESRERQMLQSSEQKQESSGVALGYSSLDQELVLESLPISGRIPEWLEGSLLRNGPARFEVGAQSFHHWFDGFSMLHRFTFQQGQVAYANKFLRSDSYVESMKEGKIVGAAFGTDPCKAAFKKVQSALVNANVSIDKMVGEFVAMTETPLPVRFDPHTLDTLGVVEYDDRLTGHHGSAHPHHDGSRAISFMTEFGMRSQFKVFAVSDEAPARRTLIGSFVVGKPSYIHSFSISEHYVIIAEYPYRVNPLDLMRTSKPFIENYKWYPEQGTRFVVMDKQKGKVVRTFTAEAFFSFHHVNAFERDGDLFVDLSAYPDAKVVNSLYLDQLRGDLSELEPGPVSEFRRYRLPMGSKKEQQASYELLSDQSIELPTINYSRYNTRDYGVAYGLGSSKGKAEVVVGQLVRVDVRERKALTWSEEECYPGEPIFVEAPDAQSEDDGVVLSVVLNSQKRNSFLLVLDAKTFQEIGRAEVPHHIPFGFHGLFFPSQK